VKYLISIYGSAELWSSIPADQMAEVVAATDAHNAALFESGELLFACGVADQADAKRVRLEEGVPVVTDGPYIETKEYLASFYIVDVDSEERALQIAAEMPSAAFRDIEVKLISHGGSADDL